jgi:hypothetical protein
MNDKVYVILKNAYEFDDFNYGDYYPCFISLNKDKVVDQFNSIKEVEISSFNNALNYYKDLIEEQPERKEDFQIEENTDEKLTIYLNNWCYKWQLVEYELDKLLL